MKVRSLVILALAASIGICGCATKQAAAPATPGAPSASPDAQLVTNVQKVENALKIAQATLPLTQSLLNDLQVIDPNAYNVVAPFASKLPTVYSSLIAACDAYVANPGSNTYQAIVNGFTDFGSQVNSTTLAIAGIKNPASQEKAQAIVAFVGTGITALAVFVQAQSIGN